MGRVARRRVLHRIETVALPKGDVGRTANLALRVSVAAAVLGATLAPAAAGAVGVLCVTAHGSVVDAYGRGVGGASVSVTPATCGGSSSASYGSTGEFSVQVDVGNPYSIGASAPGYSGVSKQFSSYSADPVTLSLPFATRGSASPTWVKSGQRVTVALQTTAPRPTTSGDRFACRLGAQAGSAAASDVEAPAGGPISDVRALAFGDGFTAALLGDGTVLTSGDNSRGQLGHGGVGAGSASGFVVDEAGTGVLSGVAAIAAGSDFVVAVKLDGRLLTWGANGDGQLGTGNTTDSGRPVPVVAPDGTVVANAFVVAASGHHPMAQLEGGEVLEWGRIAAGAGTVASPVPQFLMAQDGSRFSGATAIAAGDSHGVLLKNFRVYSWGSNAKNQLGAPGAGATSPVAVQGTTQVGEEWNVMIAASGDHSLVITSSGELYAWGDNSHGELGQGNVLPVARATKVKDASGRYLSGVSAVAAGPTTSLAVLANTTVAGWGANTSGQLGPGPAQVTSPSIVQEGGAGVVAGVTGLSAGAADSGVITTAPCTGQSGSFGVPAQEWSTTDPVLAFSAGPPDSAGFTPWTATFTAPVGDGMRVLRLCAIDRSVWPSVGGARFGCPPQGAVPTDMPRHLTKTQTVAYGVDDTPPTVKSTSPAAYGTAVGAVSPCVTLSDAGAGVARSTVTMTLDGTPTSVTTSGSEPVVACLAASSAPGLGVHRLDVRAADALGNAMSHAFVFSFASLSAAPASATVPDAEALIASASSPVPPETVTFSNLVAAVPGFDEALSASTKVGYGDFVRTFAFPTAVEQSWVQFEDRLGNLSKRYAVPAIAAQRAVHTAAVLAPSAGPLHASIPPASIRLPSLTITIPPEQRPLAVAAHLHIGAAPLGDPVPIAPDVLDKVMPKEPVPVLGSITGCLSWKPDHSSTTCWVDGSPDYRAVIGGVQIPSFTPQINAAAPDRAWGTMPSCTGCVNPAILDPDTHTPVPTESYIGLPLAGSLTLGCPTMVLGVPTNLCDTTATSGKPDGFLTARVNAAVYGDPIGRFPIWQQSHVDADPTGDSCPNGGRPAAAGSTPGGTSARIQRVAVNSIPADSANSPLVAATYRPFNAAGSTTPEVRLVDAADGGAGPTEASDANSITAESDSQPPAFANDPLEFAIRFSHSAMRGPADGHYYILSDKAVDPLGTTRPAAGAAANLWQLDGTPVASTATATGSVVLVTGTMMRNPAPLATGGGYSYLADLQLQAVVTYACS